MKKAWLARLAVGSALALLSGCGVLSWFTSTSPKAPPPLAKGEHKLSFSTQWQARLYGDWELKPYQVTRIAVGDGQIVVADGSGHLMNLSESGHQRWMRRLDG
ncbi:MAG: outer membrane protein assembly factor BamB, partial [Acidithiobacillus sp.]